MDLKFYKEKVLIHLIDRAAKLYVTVILPSKKPDQIIHAILKYSINF